MLPFVLPPERPADDTRTVCSWCPNPDGATERLERQGFRVTHGICAHHRGQVLARVNQDENERQALQETA